MTDAVRQVSGEEIEIIGASRTDSGAHAKGQVCHFDTRVPIAVDRWADAINRLLPRDVCVVRAQAVPKTFHARFSAWDRWYRYRIHVGDRDPERSRFVHWTWHRLDAEKMNRWAQGLVGEHDFRAYSEELDAEANAVREIFKLTVTERSDEVHIDVVATAYVRGMMRRISGALVEVGRGKRNPEDIAGLLSIEKRDSLQWPVVLPASGLCLRRIRYGRPWTETA